MKKIIALFTMSAVVLSVAGCSNGEESTPAATTTAPIFVQEDNYQTTAATTTTTSETEQSKPDEVKPDIPETKGNEYNIDGVYNTTVENTISDDVYYEIYIEYTKEDGEVVSETISLNDNVSYNELAYELASFGLVTTGVTRELSYEPNENRRTNKDACFEYSAIGHNLSIAPDTETALYLELVDDKGIVTDTTLLNGGSYNPSVKAISSKLFTKSKSEQSDGALKQRIPVKVIYKVYFPEDYVNDLPNYVKEEIGDDLCYDIKVGMHRNTVLQAFEDSHEAVPDIYVIKNKDFTFVIKSDDTFSEYIGDVILIKN